MRSQPRELTAARGRSSSAADRSLRSVLHWARRAVPGCDEAGLVLVGDGVAAMAAGTAHLARQLERTQCDSGRGPGVEAIRQLQVFNVGCLASSSGSWPEFARAAARLGVASSLSVPLTWAGRTLGALGLYSSRPDAFAGCEAAGLDLARHVATAVVPVQRAEPLVRRSDGFDTPAVLPMGRLAFGAAWPAVESAL